MFLTTYYDIWYNILKAFRVNVPKHRKNGFKKTLKTVIKYICWLKVNKCWFFFFGTSEFENISELSLDQKSYLEPNIERFEVQWFFVFKKVEKVLVELFHERVNNRPTPSPAAGRGVFDSFFFRFWLSFIIVLIIHVNIYFCPSLSLSDEEKRHSLS